MKIVKIPKGFKIVTEHKFSAILEKIKDEKLLSPENNKKLLDKVGHLTEDEAKECLGLFLKEVINHRFE